MASTVKVVTKPQVIHPGKERQVEHARQLIQQGLNRGMRLQETKIIPLAPDDQVGKEEQLKPEPQKPEPQKPALASEPQKPKSHKKKVVTDQVVKDNPLLCEHRADDGGVMVYSKYKYENKTVVVINILFIEGGDIILLADTNLLNKGTQVFAMDFEVFKKKYVKV